MSYIDDKVVLVTGGTDSFGKKFISTVLNEYKPAKVIVFRYASNNNTQWLGADEIRQIVAPFEKAQSGN